MNRRGVRESLLTGVRAGAFMPQRLTSGGRMVPGFLICGAQRCGTTSTYKMLSSHPDVLPAVLAKGVHYFDTSYDRSFAWYRAHFPLRLTAAVKARARGRRPLTGESSPYYLFHPLAAERIARDLPGVKAIVLLRDPVERAFSAHSHELARGWEHLDFAAALEHEPERLRGEADRLRDDPAASSLHLQHHGYASRGEYIDQILRLERALGADSLLVLDADDLFTDPGPVVAEICAFLAIPPHPDAHAFRRHNARTRSPLDPAVRRRLEDHFAPYDEKLATWWGRTPSWRREPGD